MMNIVLKNDERLKDFEEGMLSAFEPTFIPPLSVINSGECQTLVYELGGYAPAADCVYTSLTEMYDFLRLYTLRMAEAFDKLFLGSRLAHGAAGIMIGTDGGDLKLLITGGQGAADDAQAPYERVAELAMIFAERTSLPGAGEAMKETAERLRVRRPSLAMIQRTIAECEKKWRAILPG